MEKRAEEREEKFHRPECLLTDLIDFANNLVGNPEFKMQIKVSVIANWANQAPAEALDKKGKKQK